MGLRFPLDELEEMAREHVHYEFDRLSLWSRVQLPPAAFALVNADDVANVVRQATLESALLHLRNAVEFVTSPRPTRKAFETDVVADDFFDDGWKHRPAFVLGRKQAEHDTAIENLNRRLAHVSTQRLSRNTHNGQFEWDDVLRTVPRVLSAFQNFVTDLEHVHPDRAEWFAATVKRVRENSR